MYIENKRRAALDHEEMVRHTLTQNHEQGGRDLVDALDKMGLNLNAALWFLFSEEDAWKLILSWPKIESEGPKAAYMKIQKALSNMRGTKISLEDVVIEKASSSLLRTLKIAVRTGPGISGIRFSNNVINGQQIEDAYIYRLR